MGQDGIKCSILQLLLHNIMNAKLYAPLLMIFKETVQQQQRYNIDL